MIFANGTFAEGFSWVEIPERERRRRSSGIAGRRENNAQKGGWTMDRPKVDLDFRLVGRTLPVDHGFALYGAVSKVLPEVHEDKDIGMKLVRGRYIGQGRLDISPFSRLVLRVPLDRVRACLVLAGKSLEVAESRLKVGVPATRALVPAACLHSALATTRNGHDRSRFEEEISRQLEALEIRGDFRVGRRRTFGVHGKQVVGYELLVDRLSAGESVRLQERGLGGRRKMGCGFFEPCGR